MPTGLLPVFPQTPLGIPQGSAASSEVAIWSVSHLKMPITVNGSVIINYADNFFVFANSKFALDATCNLLCSAIAGLPGGDFLGVLKLNGTMETGFPMLGCWIAQQDGQPAVWPTEANLDRLNDTVDDLFHKAATLFEAAEAEKCKMLRLQAVQSYLRLRNFCHGWQNAYAFCDLDPCIKEHLSWHIENLECFYYITEAEVKAANDASVGKPDAYGHHAS